MQILISLDGNRGNDDLPKMPDIHPIRQMQQKPTPSSTFGDQDLTTATLAFKTESAPQQPSQFHKTGG